MKEGGIEIISETENVTEDGSVAGIWNLLIRWNMMGLDVKFDTHISTLFRRDNSSISTTLPRGLFDHVDWSHILHTLGVSQAAF